MTVPKLWLLQIPLTPSQPPNAGSCMIIQGLTKWQAEHIFQLTPTPPGMEDALQDMEKTQRIDKEKKKAIQKKNEAVADDYLARTVREKNLLFLNFFLHGYEHRLNAKVYSFLRRNGILSIRKRRLSSLQIGISRDPGCMPGQRSVI